MTIVITATGISGILWLTIVLMSFAFCLWCHIIDDARDAEGPAWVMFFIIVVLTIFACGFEIGRFLEHRTSLPNAVETTS